jgi:fatty-acyl-CoA synthase
MTAFDWIAKRAELTPGTVALVDTATNREFTYEEFDRRAGRLARFFRDEWGIHPGDRIAFLGHNSTDVFDLLFAAARAGAILVPLNWRLAIPELRGIVADGSPRAMIHDAAFASEAGELLGGMPGAARMQTGGEPPAGGVAMEDTAADGPGLRMERRPLEDPWYILYTAGTTGRPKGVIQTFGMALFNHLNIGVPIDLTSGDTTLNVLPTFHSGGLNLYAIPTFIAGGTAIVQQAFEPSETLRLLAERTTAFFGVPAVYLFLSRHPDFGSTDLSGVRSWACGGAPMPVALLEAYAERGIRIRQGFGMTETGPTVFLVDEENALSKAGSVGKPQMHVDVRIVDAGGRDVADGEMGELWIKGPAVTPGYWQMPETTAESITDGWLHSGDVARRDEDGYYFIVDRWKDMFISGGENVYPAEVENVLYAHPAVAEAAVIGVPDPTWQEVGRAVVVLAPEGEATAEDLISFCRERLARFKVPRSVVFVDSLPRNPAGKVLKNELRDAHGG